MNHSTLREQAYEANLAVQRHGLVLFTWGNASARDFERGLIAIKPSGVAYTELTPASMVLLELETGTVVEPNGLKASSDTPTHLVLYRSFPKTGGVVHTHSANATAWAQAGRDLPCFGTTHADYFNGTIPCTTEMTQAEIFEGVGYEQSTGEVIVREFWKRGIDPLEVPAALVRGHAPFVWGEDAAEAVHHAVVLEAIAGMARDTLLISKEAVPISQALLDKHFERKHGPDAYYGQGGIGKGPGTAGAEPA